jgi:uncharacterized protein (DUF2147 family)
MMRRLTIACCLVMSPGVALAGDPTGVWMRDNGEAKLRFAPCGASFCGTIIWVKDPARQKDVGVRAFWNMAANGANSWKGQAFNPLDGQNYVGKLELSGNTLTTYGCVMGGMMCKSMVWQRSQ